MSIAQQVPMPVLTQLQAVYQRDPEADRVALVWPEPLATQQLTAEVEGQAVRFVFCVSELAIRETLVNHARAVAQEGSRERLVLLSRFDEVHLAKDVLARLWKNEPQRISPWKTLQELIRVRQIDPRLTKKNGRWMAEALLGCFDRYQGKISFGDVLDQDNAWRALALGYLEYQEPTLDLQSILLWSRKENIDGLITALPTDVKENLGDWLSLGLPNTHELLAALLLRGHGSELLPLGLTCSILFAPALEQHEVTDPNQLHLSRGVFRERYLGGQGYGQAVLQAFGESAAALVLRELSTQGYQAASSALSKAEQILASLDLISVARFSPVLPCGFQARLDDLARALELALTGSEVSAAEHALFQVNQHGLAQLASRRETISRATMAVRLVRWLQRQPPVEGSAVALVEEYVTQGGFCDWARSAIWSGDVHESLNGVYKKLTDQVRDWRERQNQGFAQQLASIARGDTLPARFIPVEQTLARLLAPLAEQTPVLLVVLDGMSEAVYRKLAEDLSRHHWLELRPEAQPEEPCLIAALPTVTQVSRCSLLSGTLAEGGAAEEKRAFAAHGLLKKIASTKFPPKVFHKQDLSDDGSGSLHSEVRSQIAGTEHRILAAVINAIDDQLSSSSQVTVDWTLDSVALLRQVMEAAREAGRVVVVTSDHGHVLDHDSVYQASAADNGERYQPAQNGASPSDLEVLVTGPRVVMPSNKVVLPWSEKLRYTKSKSLGYHGGGSLQEVVIPLGIFINASTQMVPEGWIEIPRRIPDWWNVNEMIVAEFAHDYDSIAGRVGKSTKKSDKRPDKTTGKKSVKSKLIEAAAEVMDDMFGGAPAEPPQTAENTSAAEWIDRLFHSPVYQQVKTRAGRSAIKDEQLRSLIELLHKNHGQAMDAVVVRELMIPKIRLRGFLAGAQKLLNVDGYPILSVERDSQTIKINVADLKKQFEID